MVCPVTNQRYQPYRSLLLSREEHAELCTLSPGKAVRDLAWLWIQIIAAWAVAAALHSWWACALAAAFVGNRYYSLYIIGHDGLHRRLHDRRVVNDLINDLLVLGPIGVVTRLNRHNHMTHHVTLHCDNDPDAYKYRSRERLSWLEYVWSLTALPYVLRAVSNVVRKPRRQDQGAPERRTARDVLIIAAWQILLVISLSMLFGWWGYFVMWWIPVYVFTFAADLTRVFCEHSVPGTNPVALHDRLITFEANRLELALFAPMNMNHHAAHHLWPSIPYYNLPRATARMRSHLASLPEDAEPPGSRRSYVNWLLRRLGPMARATA
jgi:fatty acid desaturase